MSRLSCSSPSRTVQGDRPFFQVDPASARRSSGRGRYSPRLLRESNAVLSRSRLQRRAEAEHRLPVGLQGVGQVKSLAGLGSLSAPVLSDANSSPALCQASSDGGTGPGRGVFSHSRLVVPGDSCSALAMARGRASVGRRGRAARPGMVGSTPWRSVPSRMGLSHPVWAGRPWTAISSTMVGRPARWSKCPGRGTSAPLTLAASTGAWWRPDLDQYLVGQPVQHRVDIGHVRDVRPLRDLVISCGLQSPRGKLFGEGHRGARAGWCCPGCSAALGSFWQRSEQVHRSRGGSNAIVPSESRRIFSGPPGSPCRPDALPRRNSRACQRTKLALRHVARRCRTSWTDLPEQPGKELRVVQP